MSRCAGVVMGKVGSGKTTLYNKVCDKSERAETDVQSVTRNLHRHSVTWGDCAFTMIDTPGTGTLREVYEHSYVICNGLTLQPLNTIFIVVGYSNRVQDMMVQDYMEQLTHIKEEYRDMCVPIVTYMDQYWPESGKSGRKMVFSQKRKCPSRDYSQFTSSSRIPTRKRMEELIRSVFQAELNVGRVVFTELQQPSLQLVTEMYSHMSSMPQRHLEYDEQDFLVYFDVADFAGSLRMMVKDIERKIKAACTNYEDALKENYRDQGGKTAVLNEIVCDAISLNLQELNRIYETFCKMYGERMVDLNQYTAAIDLQKLVMVHHEKFREFAKGYLTYDPDDAKDWRNCIRKCEHCAEVWVKVDGCDDATTCGARLKQALWSDVFGEARRYMLQKVGRHFKFVVNPNFMTTRAAKYTSTASEKPIGCQKRIIWKDQPRLSSEELAQFFSTKQVEDVISEFRRTNEWRSMIDRKNRKIALFGA